MTDLIKAAEDGDLESVKRLLKDGVDVNLRDEDEHSALMWASWNHYFGIVSLLLKAGADVDRDMLLLWAVDTCNLCAFSLFIQAGADVNVQDEDGHTLLIHATINNDLDIVSLLLEAGADVNLQDEDGDTALMIAFEHKNLDIVSLLTRVQILDSLDEDKLDNLFDVDPYLWTMVSQHHSKRVFHYFIQKYSDLLNVSRDVIQIIF